MSTPWNWSDPIGNAPTDPETQTVSADVKATLSVNKVRLSLEMLPSSEIPTLNRLVLNNYCLEHELARRDANLKKLNRVACYLLFKIVNFLNLSCKKSVI